MVRASATSKPLPFNVSEIHPGLDFYSHALPNVLRVSGEVRCMRWLGYHNLSQGGFWHGGSAQAGVPFE